LIDAKPLTSQRKDTAMPLNTCDPLGPLSPSTTMSVSHEGARNITLTTPDPDTPYLNELVAAVGVERVAALLSDEPLPETEPAGAPAPPAQNPDAEEPDPVSDADDAAPGLAEDNPDRDAPSGPDDPGGETERPADEPAVDVD
jgi:hypothetical protein